MLWRNFISQEHRSQPKTVELNSKWNHHNSNTPRPLNCATKWQSLRYSLNSKLHSSSATVYLRLSALQPPFYFFLWIKLSSECLHDDDVDDETEQRARNDLISFYNLVWGIKLNSIKLLFFFCLLRISTSTMFHKRRLGGSIIGFKFEIFLWLFWWIFYFLIHRLSERQCRRCDVAKSSRSSFVKWNASSWTSKSFSKRFLDEY